ncbi:MAG: c-type cytochrome [Rhodanobacteraceae bacterium]
MNRIMINGMVLLGMLLLVACGPSAGQQGDKGRSSMRGMGGMHGGMMRRQAPAKAPASAPGSLNRFACLSCHSLHAAGVGPAYAWVSWRYRDHAQAASSLAQFIQHGGRGPWGGVMPNLNVPAADADAMARWILELPPEAPPGGQFQAQ